MAETRQEFDADSHRRFIIGLTGAIAAGKSTVAGLLSERGAHVIDADRVYRTLLQSDAKLSQLIAKRFGARVVKGNGIDRASLADVVFSDPEALAALEEIT